jgi:uncharacterized protein
MMRCITVLAASLALLATHVAVAERNVDSALRKAAQAGDIVEMGHQLELGAEPNQAYALVAAVQGNQLAAVKYLLAHGADPNAWTRMNLRVPVGASYSPMYVAATLGNREILGYLKSHGADINAEWNLDGRPSQTALGASILAGDVQAAQLLIEYGADVNHVPRHGDLPLMQTASAQRDNIKLAQMLLLHGADPDIKNAEGVSVRQKSRANAKLSALIDQAKHGSPGQLEKDDIQNVAMALHYKALCDAALPGYQTQVAADYSRWRVSQAEVVSQLEASPEFQKLQAYSKAAFDENRAQASDDELRQQKEALHRICEVELVDHFRTGAPISEGAAVNGPPPADLVQSAPATATTSSVVVHRAHSPVAAGGAMASPP